MSDLVRYACFEVRTSCSHCGNPLIVNGPLRDPRCNACQKKVHMGPGLWRSILEDIEDEYYNLNWKQGYNSTLMSRGFTIKRSYYKMMPRCSKCKTELDVESVRTGTDGHVTCKSCANRIRTFPAPDWLKKAIPSAAQVFGGEGEGKPPEKGVSLIPDDEAPRPVVLSCPQCGGALKITEKSDRMVPCEYCNVDVYLPDEVWRRLHPVKTVEEWFIRFEGKTFKAIKEEQKAEFRRRKKEEKADQKAAQDEEVAEQVSGVMKIGWPLVLVALGLWVALVGLYVYDRSTKLPTGSERMTTYVILAVATLVVFIGAVVCTVRAMMIVDRKNSFDYWVAFPIIFPVAGLFWGAFTLVEIWKLKVGQPLKPLRVRLAATILLLMIVASVNGGIALPALL